MNKSKNKNSGGSNTNKNGLEFEKITYLGTEFSENKDNIIKFKNNDKEYYCCHKKEFTKFLQSLKVLKVIHGCKEPDECYISKNNKKIFIIEKKFQCCSGSVCEKLQTAPFKKLWLERNCKDYEIYYIYCLSEWFIQNCEEEIKLLEHLSIPIFYSSDEKCKDNIIKFMIDKTNI